jgi:peptide/nickel transport system permease protein
VIRFLIRRIAQAIFVMWLMTVTVFLIFFVGPGPGAVAHVLAGRQATPEQVALVSARLGLNLPIWDQYWRFFVSGPNGTGLIVHQSLGYDYYHQQSVNTIIAQAFPITLSLVVGAAILWLIYGVLTGVVSAVKTRTLWDRSFTSVALFFYSMPTFVLGLALILFLYYDLTKAGINLFPSPGAQSWVGFTQNPLQWAHVLILPWVTLALVLAATYTRLTRGSMLDVFGEDFIRTARAKGMSEGRVIFRHNLRAAMTPIVTQFGLDVGVSLGGVIITESVFSLPGLGYTAVNAINQQDLPVVIGIVIVASAAVVITNLIVDILYAVVDPRVRIH